MAILRVRLGLAVIAVLLLVGVGFVASRSAPKAPREAIGTYGPTTSEPPNPAQHLGAGDTASSSSLADASAPSRTTSEGTGSTVRVRSTGGDGTSTPATSSTSTGDQPGPATGAPTATSTTSTTSTTTVPAGPHDLGGRVVYVPTSAPAQVWSMRPDGSDRRPEIGCDRAASYGWSTISPDGTQLLYDCQVAAPYFEGGSMFGMFDLFVRGVDGSSPRKVYTSRTGLPIHATWSPDGRHIALTELAQYAGIVIVDTVSGAQRSLVLPDGSSPQIESWSPDGKTVVLPGLRLLDLATGTIRRPVADSLLDNGAATDISSSWSPDGAWIYYVHGNGGYDVATDKYRRTINRVEVATGNEEELVPWTDLTGSYMDLTQAPVFASGGTVLFLDDTTVWAMDADGGHRHSVATSFPGSYLSAPTPTGQ